MAKKLPLKSYFFVPSRPIFYISVVKTETAQMLAASARSLDGDSEGGFSIDDDGLEDTEILR